MSPPALPTITVEDGTNVTGANSYIALADAITYFTNTGNTAFQQASPQNQTTALVRACFGLNAWLNGRWYGRRANAVQALDWPRRGVRDSDGYLVPYNTVPTKVQQAQCLVAAIELTTPFIQQSVTRYDSLKSERVGPINVEFKDTAPSITYWPQVIAILKDYAQIGVMPIEVTIGLTESERRGMARDRGRLNPFDFNEYFQNELYGGIDENWGWDQDVEL